MFKNTINNDKTIAGGGKDVMPVECYQCGLDYLRSNG